jgi:hypothetical protein
VVRDGLIEVDTAVGHTLTHSAASELDAKSLRTILNRLKIPHFRPRRAAEQAAEGES